MVSALPHRPPTFHPRAGKPKGKFGEHDYGTGEREIISADREKYRNFQEHFGVADEI